MHNTFVELCFQSGFEVEEHIVRTDDGYHLRMFRIPGKLTEISSAAYDRL